MRSSGLCVLVGFALWIGACSDDSPGTGNDNGNGNDTGICGDAVLDPGEECDDGAGNSDTLADRCRTDCRLPWCGDGVLDADEACDQGSANSDLIADACRQSCAWASCGDGVVDRDEACDDGNGDAGDGCDPACTVEPAWTCSGEPTSVCECVDFHHGAACGRCTVYVDQDPALTARDGRSWATALATVQEGIDAAYEAGPGCQVWVAAGTYFIMQSTPLDSLVLRSGVSVFGGFSGGETSLAERDVGANATVLDGHITPSSALMSFHVITAVGTTDATVDGFVISGGQAGGWDADEMGGGLYAYGSALTINGCQFVQNSGRYGGAVFAYGSILLMTNNFIFGNLAWDGGGLYANYASVVMANNVFLENHAGRRRQGRGGAIYNLSGDVTCLNCTLVSNSAEQGGVLYQEGNGGSAGFYNSILWGNFSVEPDQQAICIDPESESPVVVDHCAVQDLAFVGGGQQNLAVDPELVSAPLLWDQTTADASANALIVLDGSLYQVGDVVELDNDGILRTVTDVAGVVVTFAPLHFGGTDRYTRVQNWGPGATDVALDSHLAAGSPCIDMADDSFAPATDLEGNARVDIPNVGTPGTLADVGALEYIP